MIWLILILTLLFPIQAIASGYCGSWGVSGSSPYAGGTISCAYTDVNACVNTHAASGNTIYVGWDGVTPQACSATWSSRLSVTKGLNIIGAGSSSTIITSSYSGTCGSGSEYECSTGYGLAYEPTLAYKDAGFRFSGFDITFSNSMGMTIWNSISAQYNNPITKVRIDNNIIRRGSDSEVFIIQGFVHGVADNNTFNLTNGGSVDGLDELGIVSGRGENNWRYLSYSFGTSETWYYEDNTIIGPSAYFGDYIDCSWGGRYIARFNTVNHTSATHDATPIFNMHGNDDDPVYSCMGVELYRNTITSSRAGSYMFTQRGGKAMVFDNAITNGTLGKIGDYGNNNASPEGCDTATDVPIGLIDGQHQYPDTSYYFNNTGTGGQLTSLSDYGRNRYDGSDCTSNAGIPSTYDIPAVNYQYWLYSTATGSPQTVGVRRGLKATMTAITTCTEGVGFWVTDEGSWNKAEGGVQGQLYKCSPANTWALYYTPYEYPHPLRGESSAPATPSGIEVIYD
jgi:hypothetical protein